MILLYCQVLLAYSGFQKICDRVDGEWRIDVKKELRKEGNVKLGKACTEMDEKKILAYSYKTVWPLKCDSATPETEDVIRTKWFY